jgi:outer membrane assembly lipoprotein YfgL
MIKFQTLRAFQTCLLGVVLTGLVACAGGSGKPVASELGPNPALFGVKTAWTAQTGTVDFPLQVQVKGNVLVVADTDGSVVALDGTTGASLWRANVGAAISAGVGHDGRFASVVTRDNQLVMLEAGHELWRKRLTTQVFTTPLVAGQRVFVLGADRSLVAFDAQSGRKLWQNQRPGEALVLRQAGVLLAVRDTLVTGFSGRLLGLNPANGTTLWDAAVAVPRGTNDIERLVDLVAGVRRDDNIVCVRAFQAAVACVDTALRGKLLWRRVAVGSVGLHGDKEQVFGVESDGRLMAWRATDGELVWQSDKLRYRDLGAPLVVGRSVVLGDGEGIVHMLARKDGEILNRLTTDGSAIVAAPVLADNTLVVVTRKGGIYGFRPE